jgi:XTP/dITP diphosphohydrolase
MVQLAFATQNPGKQREVRAILTKHGIQPLFPQHFGVAAHESPEETGTTFEENALIKARWLATVSGLPASADDSGLEVAALGGFPGVQSARWLAGSDKDRMLGLLERTTQLINRAASFRCSICLFDPREQQADFFSGEIAGQLAFAPAGSKGFGYDPIFMPNNGSQTMAELGLAYKNEHSHRAQALEKLGVFIQGKYAKLGSQSHDK